MPRGPEGSGKPIRSSSVMESMRVIAPSRRTVAFSTYSLIRLRRRKRSRSSAEDEGVAGAANAELDGITAVELARSDAPEC